LVEKSKEASRGISGQEAPQTHGEEEAPQAFAQDQGSTPQQKVGQALPPLRRI
jgi:hypothetical protein